MDKKSYFLQLQNRSKAKFCELKYDYKIKVIVPEQILEKLRRLHTEKDFVLHGTSPESDFERLKQKYKDYDVFYMTGFSTWYEAYPRATLRVDFNLYDDLSAEDIQETLAFVCVPKNNKDYIKRKNCLIDTIIPMYLSSYYNNDNNWCVMVMDKCCEMYKSDLAKYYDYVVDKKYFYFCSDFDSDDEQWFKSCMEKYGITQQEIDIAKDAIISHKQLNKISYAIKDNLPITLGVNDAGHDVVVDLYGIKHLLITGRTGCGKTGQLINIIKSIYDIWPLNLNCQIVTIDTKEYDFKNMPPDYITNPVLTDVDDAINYIKNLTPTNKDTVILIDELSDMIATEPDIQNTLIQLSKNLKIHIVAATGRPKMLSDDFVKIFDNRVVFDEKAIADATYISGDSQEHIKIKQVGLVKKGK